MRIYVVAAGRARGTPEDALFAEYAKRLKPAPAGIGRPTTVPPLALVPPESRMNQPTAPPTSSITSGAPMSNAGEPSRRAIMHTRSWQGCGATP